MIHIYIYIYVYICIYDTYIYIYIHIVYISNISTVQHMHMGQLSTLYMVITCNDLQNDLAALQSKRNLTTSIWPLSAAMSKGHFPATNIRYPPIIKHGSGKSPN